MSSNEPVVPPEALWVTGEAAWALSGSFAWLSIILTCHQIIQHLKFYTQPREQKWIVRILFMVPIYSLSSWLSLKYFHLSIYFDTIRNVYEAFVIYNFLSLCFEYLGGEQSIITALKGRTNKPSCYTCTCCVRRFEYDVAFLRFCKRATLQFCAVKPIVALVTIILVANGVYNDGSLAPEYGYLYVVLVYNVSISLALVALLLFYVATRDLLAPFRPVLKFAVVKSVIFLSFWQGVALAIGEAAGWIGAREGISAGEVAVAYQNFLICIEMFLAALLHLFAFPASPYRPEGGTRGHRASIKSIYANLNSTLNPTDVIDDTIRNFSSTYSQYHQGDQISSEDEFAAAAAAGPPTPKAFNTRTRRSKISDTSLLLSESEDDII